MTLKRITAGVTTLVVAVAIATQVPSWGLVDPVPSHAQLDADRLMTSQMSVDVGGGMDAQMTTDGMLERSADDAYARALEEHVRLYARMTAAGV